VTTIDLQRASSPARLMLNKVPEVTLYFWVIKIMATTVGETAADYVLEHTGLTVAKTTWVALGVLAAALMAQLRGRRYIPAVYWFAVVVISIVGTLITDYLTDERGVSLWVSTGIFTVALASTFALWFAREHTLSIHTIVTSEREGFYWLTILFTFALGTAAGDLLAEQVNLGYFVSALLFASAIGAVTAAWYFFDLNPVLAFCLGYILTRPLGASVGDLLSQSRDDGGLGLGTTGTSFLFLGTILALVTFLSITKLDRADPVLVADIPVHDHIDTAVVAPEAAN
jgi:uncharacterized membrane-anchored protein